MLTVSETGGASEGVTWHHCQGLPEGLPAEQTPCQAPGLELMGARGGWWRPGLSRARAAVRRNQGPGLPPLLAVSAPHADLLCPAASAEPRLPGLQPYPVLMSPLVVSGRAGPPASVWLLVALWRSWRGEPQVWVTHRCLVRPSTGFGLRTVVQASPPWRPRGGPWRGQRKNSGI